MKLSEAIHQMNPGDKFKALGSAFIWEMNHKGIMLTNEGNRVALAPDSLNQQGKIIRDEPKVLTVEQMVTVLNISLRDTSSFLHSGCYKGAIDRADKNGQIKEYKRLKPLIDAIKDVITHPAGKSKIHPELTMMVDSSPTKWAKLEEEIENLTPPWEPEK